MEEMIEMDNEQLYTAQNIREFGFGAAWSALGSTLSFFPGYHQVGAAVGTMLPAFKNLWVGDPTLAVWNICGGMANFALANCANKYLGVPLILSYMATGTLFARGAEYLSKWVHEDVARSYSR